MIFREECQLLCLTNCGHRRLGSEIHGRGFQVSHTRVPPVPVHSHGSRQADQAALTRRRRVPKKQRSLEVDGGGPAILGRRGIHR